MKRVWLKILTMFGLCCLLLGCAVDGSAPGAGFNKDYRDSNRGTYRGSFYQVKTGDTLYFIAYITDKDVNEIIRYNNLQPPYTIHPGQRLRLWRPAYIAPAYGGTGAGDSSSATTAVASTNTTSSRPASKPVAVTPSAASRTTASKPTTVNKVPASTAVSAAKTVTPAPATAASTVSPPKSTKTTTAAKPTPTQKVVKKDQNKKIDQSKTKEYVGSNKQQNVNKTVSKPKPQNDKVDKWLWPTKGRVIKNFSAGDQGNKGIDIAGQRGQAISSTAAGTVVYSGNALRGYGNLIIVKHNEHYLSAYAHNDQLLVKEGQSVKAGQKIATMGSSGTSSVRLHFEIRYQGKSVNPNRYLP